jgi:MFS family permease
VAPLYGIALFLPTIIRDLGYKSTTAQLLTVPIYIFAATCCLVVAWLSDRMGKRTIFIIPFQIVILVGFIMCISSAKPGVIYAGIFIAAAGVYSAYPGNIALISNNLAGSSKRAVGMAVHIAGGNLSGAMGQSPTSSSFRGRC